MPCPLVNEPEPRLGDTDSEAGALAEGLRVRTRRSGRGHGHEEERHCNEAEGGAEGHRAITVKVTVAVCSPLRPAGSGDEEPKCRAPEISTRGSR